MTVHTASLAQLFIVNVTDVWAAAPGWFTPCRLRGPFGDERQVLTALATAVEGVEVVEVRRVEDAGRARLRKRLEGNAERHFEYLVEKGDDAIAR